jgi:acetyl esterase/lipase
MKQVLIAGAALAIASSGAAQDIDLAAAFGARPGIESISLSPDGQQIAFVAPLKGKGNGLYVVPVDKHVAPRRIANASGDPEVLRGCSWINNLRLVCRLGVIKHGGNTILAGSRLIAMNADASALKGLSGGLIDLLAKDGKTDNDILVGYAGRTSSVHRMDTMTGRTVPDTYGMVLGDSFLSDGQGVVRIAGAVTEDGYYQGKIYKYFYRQPPGDRWFPLSKYDISKRQGFYPQAVDPKINAAYGLQRLDGRLALYTISLDGALSQKLVASRPDVDIDGVVTLGRRDRVIGASFTTDRSQTEYFDPEVAKLRKALSPLFPGSEIDFTGASDDERRLLVRVSSDVAPGTFYVFDKGSRHLEQMILSRPELANLKLAPVKAAQVKAADGTPIPAFLTLPNGRTGKLPAIVMPHGGPEARDELGFDWLAQYFAARGYAVIQPNFRGSSGYGDAWFAKNGFKSWRTAIGDVNDAGRWLISEGIADPAKLYILGWSYGGYAALQSQVVEPDLFKAVVAIAPVTDLATLKRESADYYNRFLQADFIGGGTVAEDGSPARHASQFRAPVLMFHGDLDQNVAIRESKLMNDRLNAAGKVTRLVTYAGLDHQLADSEARADLLRQSDAFFRAQSPR